MSGPTPQKQLGPRDKPSPRKQSGTQGPSRDFGEMQKTPYTTIAENTEHTETSEITENPESPGTPKGASRDHAHQEIKAQGGQGASGASTHQEARTVVKPRA